MAASGGQRYPELASGCHWIFQLHAQDILQENISSDRLRQWWPMTASGGQWPPLDISIPCTHTIQEVKSSGQCLPVVANDGQCGQW